MHAQPPYAARRSAVLGTHGMVACTQPLAAEVGLRILRAGGNAADAAVAVAAAMQVTEPCSTGLGGDCFALHYNAATRRVTGLNGSGRAPRALTLEVAAAAAGPGATELPPLSPHAVTVPGAAAGWVDALAMWGSMSLASVLAPAIDLARHGAPVSPITAHNWAAGVRALTAHGAASASHELLTRAGCAPAAGEVFVNPTLADALQRLADGGRDRFYKGTTGEAIVAAVRAAGGLLDMDDLAAHTSTFPEPVHADYRGVRVWEIPPNGQGLTALLALNVLSALAAGGGDGDGGRGDAGGASGGAGAGGGAGGGKFVDAAAAAAAAAGEVAEGAGAGPLPALWASVPVPNAPPATRLGAALGHNSAAYLHALIEATRLAFADTRWYVADSDVVGVPTAALLSPAYAAARAALVHPWRASADVQRGSPAVGSDTVSFQVVDGAGNAVSFINSNYMGFGSGIVPRGCGFSLQNRGAGFSLEAGHPNALAPGKRPYHTIIPGLATWADDGALFASFSCMGGFMQPQGHMQLLAAMLDCAVGGEDDGGGDGGGDGGARGVDPQTAIDAPRFCIADGRAGGLVYLEEGIGAPVVAALRARGHAIAPGPPVAGWARSTFGRAQMVYRDRRTGVLWGGSDGRGDGCAVGW